jgi:hypothetical protein
MATDLNDLEQALQTYFDGLYEGDTAKLAAIFHDESQLFSVTDGKLDDMPREQWFEMVKNRSRRAAAICRAATGWCRSTARDRTPRSPKCNVRYRRAISRIT